MDTSELQGKDQVQRMEKRKSANINISGYYLIIFPTVLKPAHTGSQKWMVLFSGIL